MEHRTFVTVMACGAIAMLGTATSGHAAGVTSSNGVYGVAASCPTVGDYYYNPTTMSFCQTAPGTVLNGGTPIPGEEVLEDYPGSFTGSPTTLTLALTDGATVAQGSSQSAGGFQMPKLSAYASAGRYGVAYISAGGAQKYSYSGTDMALPFDANLTFDFVNGVAAPYILPQLTARLIILDGSWSPTSTIDFGAPPISCGTAHVVGIASMLVSTGSAATLNLTNDCSGNPFTVHNGDSFWLQGRLDVLAHRGGVSDAAHTMVVDLGASIDSDTRAGLLTTLQPLQAVPEPASWSLLIVGFSMIGSTMRHRARKMRAI